MLNRQRFLRFFKHSSRGFSLLEVVIAICLLGIIGVGLLSGLATASLALFTADERATAESLARSQMEYVKSQSYNATYYKEIALDDFPDYDIDIGIGPVPGSDSNIQKITITVKHHGREILTSGNYTLEGYKLKR